MAKAIRGHYVGTRVAIALLAALLLLLTGALVFVTQTTETTGDRAGTPAVNQDSSGGSDLFRDPNIERHAEIVALYRSGKPAVRQDGEPNGGGANLARDPYIERHAEVVARHNR